MRALRILVPLLILVGIEAFIGIDKPGHHKPIFVDGQATPCRGGRYLLATKASLSLEHIAIKHGVPKIRAYPDEFGGSFSGIVQRNSDCRRGSATIGIGGTINEISFDPPYIYRNPRPLLDLHFIELLLHSAALATRVVFASANGGDSNCCGNPQPHYTKNLPPLVPCVSGIVLMSLAIVFLVYSINRGDYFFYIGAFGGAPVFILGFLLVFFCVLPDPPTIFGFTIGAWPAPVSIAAERL